MSQLFLPELWIRSRVSAAETGDLEARRLCVAMKTESPPALSETFAQAVSLPPQFKINRQAKPRPPPGQSTGTGCEESTGPEKL